MRGSDYSNEMTAVGYCDVSLLTSVDCSHEPELNLIDLPSLVHLDELHVGSVFKFDMPVNVPGIFDDAGDGTQSWRVRGRDGDSIHIELFDPGAPKNAAQPRFTLTYDQIIHDPHGVYVTLV